MLNGTLSRGHYEGAQWMLNLEICGEADDVTSGIQLMESAQPDVMVVDITLREGSGLELIKRVKAHNENIRILVVSMHDDALFAERTLRTGACGYINKQEAGRKIVEAIQQVLQGKLYVSPSVSTRILAQLAQGRNASRQEGIRRLSDRELEVFLMMGKGLTTNQIAANLHVSNKTVETYRQRIKEKLGTPTAAELNREAFYWVMQSETATATAEN